MPSDDSLDVLSRALTQMSGLIAAVPATMRRAPTPCPGWDVAALVDHVYAGIPRFVVAAGGGRPDWGSRDDRIGDDWVAEFSAAAARLLDTWSSADLEASAPASGGSMPMRRVADLQTTELAVHAWDLARATGQSIDLDAAVGEQPLRFGRDMLKPEHRGGEGGGMAFGAEVAVAADAPLYDRLAGWFGRRPDWPERI